MNFIDKYDLLFTKYRSITLICAVASLLALAGCSDETKTVTVKDGVETTVITRKVDAEKKPKDYRYSISLMTAGYMGDSACTYTYYSDEIRFFNGYVSFTDSKTGKTVYGSNFIVTDNGAK